MGSPRGRLLGSPRSEQPQWEPSRGEALPPSTPRSPDFSAAIPQAHTEPTVGEGWPEGGQWGWAVGGSRAPRLGSGREAPTLGVWEASWRRGEGQGVETGERDGVDALATPTAPSQGVRRPSGRCVLYHNEHFWACKCRDRNKRGRSLHPSTRGRLASTVSLSSETWQIRKEAFTGDSSRDDSANAARQHNAARHPDT